MSSGGEPVIKSWTTFCSWRSCAGQTCLCCSCSQFSVGHGDTAHADLARSIRAPVVNCWVGCGLAWHTLVTTTGLSCKVSQRVQSGHTEYRRLHSNVRDKTSTVTGPLYNKLHQITHTHYTSPRYLHNMRTHHMIIILAVSTWSHYIYSTQTTDYLGTISQYNKCLSTEMTKAQPGWPLSRQCEIKWHFPDGSRHSSAALSMWLISCTY